MIKTPLLVIGTICILLQSCAQMLMKDHNFRTTESVEINGAMVNSALKPMGGSAGLAISAMVYSAGTGSLDGPFLWRIEAEGKEGVHEWIRVNKVSVSTDITERSETYPGERLGSRAKFVPLPREEGKTFAKFQIPGKLTVFPREDGKTKIRVNVSVHAKGRTETKWLVFEMEPESKWRTETIFIPVEIVRSFGGNPREWDW